MLSPSYYMSARRASVYTAELIGVVLSGGGGGVLLGVRSLALARAHHGAGLPCSDPHRGPANECRSQPRTLSNSGAAAEWPKPASGTTPAGPRSFDRPSNRRSASPRKTERLEPSRQRLAPMCPFHASNKLAWCSSIRARIRRSSCAGNPKFRTSATGCNQNFADKSLRST